jgi:RNA polymerase sigma-70 factor (ECF subfamily)
MAPVNDLDAHLAAIVAGDARAFARWVTLTEGSLRDGLRPFARVVDTEAILQEAFLRVWQVAPRFVPDGRPNGLLRLASTIARNLALSEARARRSLPAEIEDLELALARLAQGDAAPPVDPLLRKVIATCRERLPEKPALALAARLDSGGGEPDEPLAERLGMRLNTFLQNFTRARKMLADCLREHGVELHWEPR